MEVVILPGAERDRRARRRRVVATAVPQTRRRCSGWPPGRARSASTPSWSRGSGGRGELRAGARRSCSTSTSACRPEHPQRYRSVIGASSSSTSTSRRAPCRAGRRGRRPPGRLRGVRGGDRRAGGVDLQLLGIGTDGHIAFNEPGSSLVVAHPGQDADRADAGRQRAVLRVAGRGAAPRADSGAGHDLGRTAPACWWRPARRRRRRCRRWSRGRCRRRARPRCCSCTRTRPCCSTTRRRGAGAG